MRKRKKDAAMEDKKKKKNTGKVGRFWGWIRADKKRTIGAILVVVLILGIGYWRIKGGTSSTSKYQTASVIRGTIVSTVSASGRALTTSIFDINTAASGTVNKVYVKDGDKVYAGEAIAQLTLDTVGQQQYNTELVSYLAAENSVTTAQTSYYTLQAAMYSANQKFINDAVARGLATDDPTYIQENDAWLASEANFTAQATSLEQAKASLTNASLNLQQSSAVVTTPYAGTISNITLVPGMVLSSSTSNSSSSSSSTTSSSSQRVATIVNQSTPIVNVTLSEIDVPKVKVGQKATVTFDSISGETFTGEVATIDRIGSVSSNVTSYGVNIKLDTTSDKILPNMAATANIIISTAADILEVPSTALVTSNGETLAKTLQNGKEVDVAVTTGISDDTNTEIISGLTEGETVIIGNASSTTSSSKNTSVFGGGFGGGTRVFSGRGG